MDEKESSKEALEKILLGHIERLTKAWAAQQVSIMAYEMTEFINHKDTDLYKWKKKKRTTRYAGVGHWKK